MRRSPWVERSAWRAGPSGCRPQVILKEFPRCWQPRSVTPGTLSLSDSGGHKLVLTEWRIFGGQLVRGHNNAPLEIELPSLKAFKGAGRHHQQVFLTDTSLHLAEKLLCLKGLVTLPGGVRPGSCCPYRGHVLPELLTLDATGHLVPFGLEIEEGRWDENGRPTLVSTRSSMLSRLSNGGHHLQRVAGGATVTRMNLDGQMLERTITTTSGFVYYLKVGSAVLTASVFVPLMPLAIFLRRSDKRPEGP